MKKIRLHTVSSESHLHIGESLGNSGRYFPETKTVIITDENVYKYHGDKFPPGMVIRLQPGESSKTLEVVSGIYAQLIENEFDRGSFILGIGGGVVTDITGFIASTFLRGVPFGFVASTLLSQVDAAIGGKNGVNYEGYKNMIGVVRQPEFVICDPALLGTLDPLEYRQGFAEVVKYGAIFEESLFSYLETSYMEALDGDPEVLERIIYKCVQGKCRVVQEDENDSGERRKLNFGHTFAHAFEKLFGISHGHAVSIGMIIAAKISANLGLIHQDSVKRLEALLECFGLSLQHPGMSPDIYEIIKQDKKRGGDNISLILLDKIGNAIIKDVPLGDLKKWIDDLC